MNCKQDHCTRRVHSRGWCTTHYRRWRSGHDMDAPIRGYVRYQEGFVGTHEPVNVKTANTKRKKPFAAEYALLEELGLRRH